VGIREKKHLGLGGKLKEREKAVFACHKAERPGMLRISSTTRERGGQTTMTEDSASKPADESEILSKQERGLSK